ncbi:DUF1145 domain-containing protein [Pseudomonas sp. NCHU5208]|uniref:DUF1145 domain-containing protein n=1 Tax=unclassified Pseudomonas TaxID=196821 RepID=UPI003F9BDAFE
MKGLMIGGKALSLAFWLLVLGALAGRLDSPFEQLILLLAASMALLHGLQLWLFSNLLAATGNGWGARLQVLLFGIFHLYSLKPAQNEPASPSAGAEQEAVHA